jgi:hypothetical protein
MFVSLGAHMNLVCAALIPDNRESEEMMRKTCNAIRKALHLILTRYKRCPIHGCIPCTAFQAVHDGVQALLADACLSGDCCVGVNGSQ